MEFDLELDNELVRKIKEAMNTSHTEGVAQIKKYLDEQNNTVLNIAVTGESGSGKSTFVNAFRGVKTTDKGAAPTGCLETTMEVRPFPHPNFPNVTLWDLPGIGTTKFPADQYLKHVGFEKFDFFIIISATRFTENDMKLAQEIQKMEKKFYFVRSKIDNDLYNEQKSQIEFNKEKTLKEIREDCIRGLQEGGIESPQVFLVSSFKLRLFDFQLLEETLEIELPAHKRNALLFAMPNVNLEIIKKKKRAFRIRVFLHAALSSVLAVIPGLSLMVDLGLLANVVTTYVVGFGLDRPSLERLATITGVPLDDLLSVVVSQLAATSITQDLVKKVLSQWSNAASLTVAEEAFRVVPVIGVPVAMSLSFVSTYKALNILLDMIAEDAQRVFKRSLGLKCTA